MRKMFAILLALNLCLGITLAQDSTQVKGAHISVSESTHDFGDVPVDTMVSHIFVIKNVGSDSLRIYRIKSG